MRGDELAEQQHMAGLDAADDRLKDELRFSPPSPGMADDAELMFDENGVIIGCRYKDYEIEVVII